MHKEEGVFNVDHEGMHESKGHEHVSHDDLTCSRQFEEYSPVIQQEETYS